MFPDDSINTNVKNISIHQQVIVLWIFVTFGLYFILRFTVSAIYGISSKWNNIWISNMFKISKEL